MNTRKLSCEKDIVSVLQNRFVSCHRSGVSPWAMNSYAMVKGWGAMIRETILTLRMPPGQIDD